MSNVDRHRSLRCTYFLNEATQAISKGEESLAIYSLWHSLRAELRSTSFLLLAQLHSKLGWSLHLPLIIDAGIRLAEYEGNAEIVSELLQIRTTGIETSNTHSVEEPGLWDSWSEEIESRLSSYGLSNQVDFIRTSSEPCFRLSSVLDPSDNSRSKFGGVPLVPNAFEWPVGPRSKPLPFLCQIDLADLAVSAGRLGLPSQGMLSVFFDESSVFEVAPGKAPAWQVFYFEDTQALSKATEPSTLDTPDWFLPCRVEFAQALSIPDLAEICAKGHFLDDPISTRTDYADFYKDQFTNHRASHQLGGHPVHLQNHLEFDLQYLINALGANGVQPSSTDPKDWQLLLQIDSDPITCFEWGDSGRLYFVITKQDLLNRRFENCLFALQCY